MSTENTGSPDQHLDEDRRHDDSDDELVGSGEKPDIYPIEYAPADAADVAELAEAERAAARHGATPEQLAGVAAAGRVRRAEERLEGWRGRHR